MAVVAGMVTQVKTDATHGYMTVRDADGTSWDFKIDLGDDRFEVARLAFLGPYPISVTYSGSSPYTVSALAAGEV